MFLLQVFQSPYIKWRSALLKQWFRNTKKEPAKHSLKCSANGETGHFSRHGMVMESSATNKCCKSEIENRKHYITVQSNERKTFTERMKEETEFSRVM
jgi:hypothetical protein